jgi:methyl-accepting chemotaxis protein
MFVPLLKLLGLTKTDRIIVNGAALAGEAVAELVARNQAIDRSQAVIEFSLQGEILYANQNFLNTLGYTLDEIVGRKHGIFVDAAYRQSAEYQAFWDKLAQGEFHEGTYRRLAKDGSEIWIQATYNPVLDVQGKPVKVVKFATDVTEAQVRNAESLAMANAINKSQAVISFDLDGTILDANQNFLGVMGYGLKDIVGKHHSMFAEPTYAASAEYREFWAKLGAGQFDSGKYKRIARGGRTVWIQASYNPVFDASGKPTKIVKFAQDITEQVEAAALDKAVLEVRSLVTAAVGGDLTSRISLADKKGDVANLCDGINELIESMAGVVGQIRVSTESINTASREIATGNQDLSARTESQASSLQETASSMEELTATVKHNAENARMANQLVLNTAEVARRGGEAVGEVVETMNAISQSSRNIADIITVIDGIAFQTNILALNAAVEAARAGEQGRGFAVVATEVRNLAHRSATAAKEIKQLIADSASKVDSGTKLVDSAGKTMEEIVLSVKRVTDIMAEIASASAEQSAGIQQVNLAVTQMDTTTQQNAALVEQAAAAAESLREQAQLLSGMVAQFNVGGGSPDDAGSATLMPGVQSAIAQQRIAPAKALSPQAAKTAQARLPAAKYVTDALEAS